MTKRGLYLQGGGAKGAYQAGVLQAFYEKGITFKAISGTSIGSINSFFWATNQMNLLKKMWFDLEIPDNIWTDNKLFIKNEFLLDMIREIEINTITVNGWFVNFADVKDNKMINLYENLVGKDSDQIINAMDYSTKLPMRDENKKIDLSLYEGMYIDGGMVNNTFIEPLVNFGLDEIIIIPLNNFFEDKVLDEFDGKVTIIYPPMLFEPGDTTRMDKEVIKKWFELGYEEGKKI